MFRHSSFRITLSFLLTSFAQMAGSPARLIAEPAAPVLVADFSPGRGPAELLPAELSAIGAGLFFAADFIRYGSEPWATKADGDTRLLGDLCPGTCGSSPQNFTALGEHVVFSGQATQKLYSVTGDRVETLADLGDSYPVFTRLGDVLFVAYRRNNTDWILRSDGTREGTRLASDFCSASGCVPQGMIAIGDAIYYWRDGQLRLLVAEGDSRFLAALDLPAYSFTPLDATRVVFSNCVRNLSFCPAWVTDGTPAGTGPLEMEPGITNGAHLFFSWRGRVYFRNAVFATVSTDGTPAGTRLESGFTGNEPLLLAATDDFLFYSISSDSTAFAIFTLRAVDTAGNHVEILGNITHLEPLGRLGSKILFSYHRDGAAFVLATDGTPGGTTTLVKGSASPTAAVLGGFLYFGLEASAPAGRGLWRTDGSPAGTRQVELGHSEPFSSFIEPWRVGGSLLLFGELGFSRSPWRLDPESLAAAPADPRGRSLEVVAGNGSLLFAEESDTPSRPLLAFTPTSLAELPASLAYGASFADDGRLYFSDTGPGKKIWVSDGTAAGTRELIDFLPGWLPCGGASGPVPCLQGAPRDITPSGNRVFFSEQEEYLHSAWVWERDQPAATRLPFRNAYPLAPLAGGKAILRHLDSEDFWISDGTDAGTRQFFARPADSSLDFVPPRRIGNRLYFVLRSDDGAHLWASDLETGETQRLTSEGRAILTAPIPLGDRVIFRAGPDGRVWELGLSDGTPAGTRWLDLGATFEYPDFGEDPFVVDRQRFVFAAAGDAAGRELWISDGTPNGTYRLIDLAPGAQPSSPDHFALAGQRLFFQADDGGGVGRELWALDLPPMPACPSDKACLMDGRYEVEVTALTPTGTFRGQRVAGGGDSAVFTFFSENNWEILVKVLDGCTINGRRWVFAAAATDIGFTLRVVDRATGAEKVYENRLGEPAIAVTDTTAFGCN